MPSPCSSLLAVSGRLRFLADEMPTWARRIAALVLLWVVLVVCVFYPTLSPGDAADVDPQTLWFASIFTGQFILGGFLLVWWVLAQPVSLLRFLRLERRRSTTSGFGLGVGAVGWILAIASSATVALVLLGVGVQPHRWARLPSSKSRRSCLWLTDLPVWRKLIVVAVAMTVEEAFYRAFLQTRVGWVLSSALFALSHGGYGLPTLTASVFAVSLAIGWALRPRGNLLPCIVAHGVFDAVQLLVVMPLAIEHLRAVA